MYFLGRNQLEKFWLRCSPLNVLSQNLLITVKKKTDLQNDFVEPQLEIEKFKQKQQPIVGNYLL